MKISSIPNGSMDSMSNSCHVKEPLFERLRDTLRNPFMNLDKMMIAIALSEAGDVEGAIALLGRHDK